jgi:hypothetical protein
MGDASFVALARGFSYTVNLPYDPIPLVPPDIVDLIERDPDRIRWGAVWQRFPGQFPIPGLHDWVATARNLDYLTMLSAANLNPTRSPHQTYQYIRACWAGLAGHVSTAAAELADLCKALGLFDPWVSGFLERGRPWELPQERVPSVRFKPALADVATDRGAVERVTSRKG